MNNLPHKTVDMCVKPKLYLTLKWIILGEDEIDNESECSDDSETDSQDELEMKSINAKPTVHQNIINIGHKILTAASNGRKCTPIHIATAVFLHHANRSKASVDYTHVAGTSVAYETTLHIITSPAEKEIDRFIENDNTCVLECFIQGRMVQFVSNNFDHNKETIDGKGTFHITQCVAFQSGPHNDNGEPEKTSIGREKSPKISL